MWDLLQNFESEMADHDVMTDHDVFAQELRLAGGQFGLSSLAPSCGIFVDPVR
jgi:hypothetical protein